MSSHEEDGPFGQDPIAHRTRSRAPLRGGAPDRHLPSRRRRQRRQNPGSILRDRSRSPIDRVIAAENHQELDRSAASEQQGEEQPICPICLDEYDVGEDCTTLSCSHRFHSGCICRWLQQSSTCPLCRAFIPQPNAQPSQGNGSGAPRRIEAWEIVDLTSEQLSNFTFEVELDDQGMFQVVMYQ